MTPHEANQQLADELRSVLDEAEELLQATTGVVDKKAEVAHSRLTATLASIKAAGERLQEQAAETAEAGDRIIREHPYESIGVALAAGLLVGALAARL